MLRNKGLFRKKSQMNRFNGFKTPVQQGSNVEGILSEDKDKLEDEGHTQPTSCTGTPSLVIKPGKQETLCEKRNCLVLF